MGKVSKFLLPTIYIGIIGVMVMSVVLVLSGIQSFLNESPLYQYTLDGVFSENIVPVVKEQNNVENVIRPYLSDKVKVGRYFYDYESDNTKQEQSLILYGDTYMQNNGVDYVSNDKFDVVSILKGEVISIEDSEIYGKILKIKHNDNLISVYSNIKDVLVSVGYTASQGEIIASSDKSKIDNGDNSMLHFEIYYKGNAVDPESLYTMSVSELQ